MLETVWSYLCLIFSQYIVQSHFSISLLVLFLCFLHSFHPPPPPRPPPPSSSSSSSCFNFLLMKYSTLKCHLCHALLRYNKLLLPWASVSTCLYSFKAFVLILVSQMISHHFLLLACEFIEHRVHISFTMVSQSTYNNGLFTNTIKVSKEEKE